jgi:hypothetical protein
MSMKSTIISSFAKIILGSALFERIKATVLRQEEKYLAGSQKRDAVLVELQVIGISTATYLINLGIELAVAWLKTQSEKK